MNDTTTKEDGKLAQALEWLNAPREEPSQEYQHAFGLWCEIETIYQQIRELETTQPVGVTEILARRAALKELHTERARLLAVLDGQEQPEQEPSPAPTPAEPTPVLPAKEKPAERRARWLDMFEEEQRRASRGALQRLADREGRDRSNMGKDIAKARKEREAQKQAGPWAAQLVQNGKRAN